MKKTVLNLLLIIWLFGCQDEKNKTIEPTLMPENKTKLEMYQMSEMAALMEQMYVDNQRIKHKIENNEWDFGTFPEYYLKIHTATFTEPSDLDDFFVSEAQRFLKFQELIYTDTTNLKINFNNMVTSCIECHTVKCTGPIERIKKLYIK